MKQHYVVACLGALFSIGSTAAYAQTEFRPGYLVKTAGDTVRGEIAYRGIGKSAERCVFRATGEQATTTWLPGQIKGYGLASGEHFTSQLTPMPVPPAPEGSTVPVASVPARQLFLEVLTEGPAALLNRRDEDLHDHFYVLKAGAAQPTELVQTRLRIVDNGIIREQIMPVYRGTLTEQFADCPDMLLSITKTEFKSSSLVAAFNRYNACRQPGWVAPSAIKRTEVGIEVLAGGQASSTYYSEPKFEVTMPAGLAPEVGMALSLGRRVLRQRLTFRAELHYVRQVAEASSSQQLYLPDPSKYDIRFVTSYLRVPILVRYSLPGTRVRPFLEAGFSMSYAPKLDPQIRFTGNIRTEWLLLTGSRAGYREYEFGLLAGLGVQFPGLLGGHSLAVVGRAEKSNGFVLINGYNMSVFRGNFLISYNLTKN